MFENYLRVAWRNLVNQKLYSAINIFGLAVGLAACILISLYVRDQLAYDKHWENAERIYRLHTTFVVPGREPFVTVVAQGPAKAALQNFFPEDIQYTTRFSTLDPVVLRDGNSFSEEVTWTDPETADIFDLTVLAGDIRQALSDNSSLAISESFARKHFGDESPLGQVLTLRLFDLNRDYRVAAVFADLPDTTVLKFNVLAMIDESDWTAQSYLFEQWFSVNTALYFQLREGADIDQINRSLDAFADQLDLPAGAIDDKDVKASDFIRYSTMAIGDIQLNPAGMGEMKPIGNRTTVAIFAAIAGLILLIACINFMNLATAKSTQRAREVALRKVMGASRRQLMAQFFGESVLVAILGLLVGIVLVELVLPAYSQFLGTELMFDYGDTLTQIILISLVLAVGLVGGVYPALVISGFLPARVLKANRSVESEGSARFRNALVVIQFAISICLIVATVTVYGQMQYSINLDPGFNKDQLLTVKGMNRPGAKAHKDAIREEIQRLPEVESAAYVSQPPFDKDENNVSVEIPGKPDAGTLLVGTISIDYDFLDTMQIPLLAGRNYHRERALDAYPKADSLAEGETPRGNLIVNEGALRRFGFGTPDEALGKEVLIGVAGSQHQAIDALFTIIGVIPDINMQSLRQVIRPEIYFMAPGSAGNLVVRFKGDPLLMAANIETIWQTMVPDVPFSYEFADEAAAEDFLRERSTATMLALFAILAVFVACLGLYGLASFTAERRTKEIGIRKVLGANVLSIVRLLLWQFAKPVLVANLLAWPIAIWSLSRWLEGFPYRIEIWVVVAMCLLAGTVALLIAWLTVGGNAARVASRSPIHALRYE